MGSVGAKQGSSGKTVNNGKMIDYDAIESTFKEGKYNKTNGVPVVRTDRNGVVHLDTKEGYGTRINGEVFYIQKDANRSWVANYNGMIIGRANSLQSAKEELQKRAGAVNNLSKEQKNGPKQIIDYLNRHGGKATKKELNKINAGRVM